MLDVVPDRIKCADISVALTDDRGREWRSQYLVPGMLIQP
jgi:hypothetical protein